MSMTNRYIYYLTRHISCFFFFFLFFFCIFLTWLLINPFKKVKYFELNEKETNLLLVGIVGLTCEFLETWFHQILYIRNLYPRSIFEKQKKFQVPVYIATHPGVQEYISNFVQACYSLIAKDDIRFICLTILQQDEAVEKFVFEINLTCQEKELTLTDLE
ncbi:DNA-binding protein [Thamnidium elegans]|nr:DNA-binding protein [Thamnidium elegans]